MMKFNRHGQTGSLKKDPVGVLSGRLESSDVVVGCRPFLKAPR